MNPEHRFVIETSCQFPLEVEAGAPIALTIYASCPCGCDLEGQPIEITGPDSATQLCRLRAADDTVSDTGEVVVTTPRAVGEHLLTIAIPAHDHGGIVHDATGVSLTFRTIPHRASMAVWSVPTPVAVNRPFSVNVGVQCSAACDLTGRRVILRDASGQTIAAGTLGETHWSAAGLHWTSVALAAPSEIGVAAWTVHFAPDSGDPTHQPASAGFSSRVDPAPEHHVTVAVVDEKSGAPVEDLEVRLGLYLATTDHCGTVQVGVPAGEYELSIRKDGYKARPTLLKVEADLAVTVVALTALTRVEREANITKMFDDYPWS